MSEQDESVQPIKPGVPGARRRVARSKPPVQRSERGADPADPHSAGDDLLSPEPAVPSPEDEQPVPVEDMGSERPPDPRQSFVRIGWALVAVVVVFGVLMIAELIRISSALDNTQCIQSAEAHYLQAVGPGVSAQYAGLDRLVGNNQLAKCGH